MEFNVKKILLLGGESSGKTTIAETMKAFFDCAIVKEFGREFGEKTNNVYTFADMDYINMQQLRLESAVAAFAPNGITVCDTSSIVTAFYSNEWYGKVSPQLQLDVKNWTKTYTHIFLLVNDFPFVQDGTRQGIEFSTKQFFSYKATLESLGLDYTILTGPVDKRIATILETI